MVIKMSSTEKKKYVKYELTYKQKQRLLKLSEKKNIHPEELLYNLEVFFEDISEFKDKEFWEKLLTFFNTNLLEDKTKQRADDIIDMKKRIKLQKELLMEYEDDYLTIVELGKSLETLTKKGVK